jgi:hypothetical protein
MSLYEHNAQDCLNIMSGPTASLTGADVNSMATNPGLPLHNGTALDMCKGAFLAANGTAGYLTVHLVDDAATTFYNIYLVPGAVAWVGLFDQINKSTSTVALDTKLTIFPYLYAKQPA